MNSKSIIFQLVLITLLIFSGCNSNNVQPKTDNTIQTLDSLHILTYNYIEIDKIKQISKFRSGIGHNYSDDFEQCLSMKHYFYPLDSVDWSKIKIYAPIDSRIVRLDSEWAGVQIHLQPINFPKYNIIIFHLNFIKPMKLGDTLKSGEQIGFHIGYQTYSDIAVSYSEANKYKLISYFDILPDSLFSKFKSLGAILPTDFIITKDQRLASPLKCLNDTFETEGSLKNWFYLKH